MNDDTDRRLDAMGDLLQFGLLYVRVPSFYEMDVDKLERMAAIARENEARAEGVKP